MEFAIVGGGLQGALLALALAGRRIVAAEFRTLVWCSRLPGIAQLLELAYRLFAKNRLRLTGRCAQAACAMPRSRTGAR